MHFESTDCVLDLFSCVLGFLPYVETCVSCCVLEIVIFWKIRFCVLRFESAFWVRFEQYFHKINRLAAEAPCVLDLRFRNSGSAYQNARVACWLH